MSTEQARAIHVLNRELMEELLDSAPCRVVACSGYAFAISAPSCTETPFEVQKNFHRILKRHYDWTMYEPNFGQNATTLMLLTRREGVPEVAK